jgi:dephospho-CoA kinase
MKIFITGVSGTGKSTTIEKLQEKGIHAIDIDAVPGLCRWVHTGTQEVAHWHSGIGSEFFETHQYICDREKLIALMNEVPGPVVVAGISDTQTHTLFDLFDKIFLFRCDEEVFLKRIKERTSHDFGKHESEQEMIRGWYKEFEQEMLNKGAMPIDTDQPVEQIVARILHELELPMSNL